MKCLIKKNNLYYGKFLFLSNILSKNTLKSKELPTCHWVCKADAKIFNSVSEAKAIIKINKLNNVEIEKIKKGDVKNEK